MQFAAGTAERRYVAIVEGVMATDEGTLRDVLLEDRSLRVRPVDPSRAPPRGRRARIAITRYRVIERRADVTRVALHLGTGRRHQIRVQLAKLGHPVVGDDAHGARRDPLRRLCLHATRLGFRHPDTGVPVELNSAPPAAFGDVGRPAERRAVPAPEARTRGDREARRRPGRPGPMLPGAGTATGVDLGTATISPTTALTRRRPSATLAPGGGRRRRPTRR
jgi:hypothetical protein